MVRSTAYIVIGIAGKDNDHLNILANIVAVCEDKNEVEKLIKAKSRREIYQMLHGETNNEKGGSFRCRQHRSRIYRLTLIPGRA